MTMISDKRTNLSDSPLLLTFLFRSWDLMINETNAKSNGYLFSELSSDSLPSAEAFAWFFEV